MTAQLLTFDSMSEAQRGHYRRRMTSLARFIDGPEVRRVPAGVRAPLSAAEWQALTVDEREHRASLGVREAMTARAAELAEREAATSAAFVAIVAAPRAEPTAPTDGASARPRANGYVVPCACMCGAFVPTRGPRPVLAYKGPGHSWRASSAAAPVASSVRAA